MCAICGCGDGAEPSIMNLQSGERLPLTVEHSHEHSHGHSHGHSHAHSHDHAHAPEHHPHEQQGSRTLHLEQAILARNNQLAERNRGWFAARNILALNLVSAPGSGKTTLLEKTLRDLSGEIPFQVIEGDQATIYDAQRIQATGCRVVQINTGTGCHLDASMLARGVEQLDPPLDSVVLIENVGNLVCPALFDLGERAKVVVISVTEGDDKPAKYPHMIRASSVLLLNKIDLLPYVSFDVDRFLNFVREVNPTLEVFTISATRGDGLTDWYDWLRGQRQHRQTLAQAITSGSRAES